MIVELFGPAGAGKTTVASALTRSLREHGRAVTPVLSYRPAECPHSSAAVADKPPRHRAAPFLRRLARPAIEILKSQWDTVPEHRVDTASELMKLMQPKSLIWSVKMRQYLSRLLHVWERASLATEVVLFDQAFIQAVASLAVLCRPDDATFQRALRSIPRPDLIIRVDARRDLLQERLRERLARQGRIERLLEFSVEANLEMIEVLDRLRELLRAQGQAPIDVTSVDSDSLRNAIARIEGELSGMLEGSFQERPLATRVFPGGTSLAGSTPHAHP